MNEPLRDPELKFFTSPEREKRDPPVGKAELLAPFRPLPHMRGVEMSIKRLAAVPHFQNPEKARLRYILRIGVGPAARLLQRGFDYAAHRGKRLRNALGRQAEGANDRNHQKLSW